MPGPWLLLTTALTLTLTLTLTGVPGGRAEPAVDQQEETKVEVLKDILRRFGESLEQLLRGQENGQTEFRTFHSKHEQQGKREEAEEGTEEKEGGAVGPHKRQQPDPWENAASWSVDVTPQKRQHPGRRSWLGYTFTKRQHPGRRLVDPKAQRRWREKEEGEEEESELVPEKRQHPGKRALGGQCKLNGDCDQASLLLELLDDLNRVQRSEEKRQHPGRRAAWAREPLEE